MTRLGVAVAIIDNRRVLLTKREDFEVWCLPGGAVDPFETVAQAAVREVREETGLEVQLTRMVGIYSRPTGRAGGLHLITFAAQVVDGVMRLAPREVLAADWFDRQSLPAPLLQDHRYMIDDALNGAVGLARVLNIVWPFPSHMTRAEVYELRDRSGLSRHDFYLRHFKPVAPHDIQLEVGDEPSPS